MGSSNKRQKTKPARVVKFTWAQAFRDVIIQGMSKGQLLPLGILLVTLITVIRMPNDELSIVIQQIVSGLKDWSLFGWGLVIVVLVLWSAHARHMRKMSSAEVQRVGKEKTEIQQQNTQVPLGTSDR